eukprot:UN26352
MFEKKGKKNNEHKRNRGLSLSVCHKCSKNVYPNDNYVQVGKYLYHDYCFCCDNCNRIFKKFETWKIPELNSKEKHVWCEKCYAGEFSNEVKVRTKYEKDETEHKAAASCTVSEKNEKNSGNDSIWSGTLQYYSCIWK